MKKEDFRKIILEEIEKLEAGDSLDEGFLDRLKAQVAGLKGNLGSAASGLAGKALGSLGAQGAAAELQQASAERAQAAKDTMTTSLLRSHSAEIVRATVGLQKAFDSLNHDIKKIGIVNPELAKQIAGLRTDTVKSMNGLISFLRSGGQSVKTNATKVEPVSAPVTAPAQKPEPRKEPEVAAEPEIKQEPKLSPAVSHSGSPASSTNKKPSARPEKKPLKPELKPEPVAQAPVAAPESRPRVSARARR